MTYKVATLYQFVALPDPAGLRASLHALCAEHGVKGTLLLAPEGFNGTIAGEPPALDAVLDRIGAVFGGRLDNLEIKFSAAAAMPFGRLKVRLKREIVTLNDGSADPCARVGAYVEPAAWNALIAEPDVLVVDTRNRFEVAMGSFPGAVDPGLARFSDFRAFAAERLDPARDRRVALFCTGGIRCEKATSYLLARGFSEVYHLKGGILAYLDKVPAAESRWTGACFVFDERVALGHGLVPCDPALSGAGDA